MEWMQDADDENESNLDPLLALANQIETQATPANPTQKARLPVIKLDASLEGKLDHSRLSFCLHLYI